MKLNVRRIIKEGEDLGLPELQIIEIGMRLRFIVPLAESLQLTPVSKASLHKKEGTSGDPVTQVTPQVTPQVNRLLDILNGEMGRDQLQSRLGLRARKNFRTLYLAPALQQGLVEMTIPAKPNSRLQKYRLTSKGKAVKTEARHE